MGYQEVSEIAQKAGIYETKEISQAIRFLHDLGSIQYFETTFLKDIVVINPQVSCIFLFFTKENRKKKQFHLSGLLI
jgi:hypothetical protein